MKFCMLFFLVCFSVLLPYSAYAYEDDLDGLLAQHVKPIKENGITYNGVDYDAWSHDPRHEKVLSSIASFHPATLLTQNEKLAFWINAYNVFTIDIMIKTGERDSIKNQGSFFTTPWQKHDWVISGRAYTLDRIEHEIVRKMGEPRIHFALNCAAKSCPDLRRESYRAERLEAQLEDQTRLTLNNPTKGFYVMPYKDTVRVSRVMDWYGEDFHSGDVRSWLRPYKPKDIKGQTGVLFFNYDWSLNKQ